MPSHHHRRDPKKIAIAIPSAHPVGLAPLIVAAIITGIEFCAAFLDIILQSTSGTKDSASLNTFLTRGLLSATAINFNMTWCIPCNLALSFIENSFKWQLNRKKCNLFGSLNLIVAADFLIAVIFTWLWANNAALMTDVVKYLLIPFGLKYSAQQLKTMIYTPTVKYAFDLQICWAFPLQCVIVLIDTIIAMCLKGRARVLHILVLTTPDGRIHAKIDPHSLD